MNKLSHFLLVFLFLSFLKLEGNYVSYSHVLFNFLGEGHLDLPVTYTISFHKCVLWSFSILLGCVPDSWRFYTSLYFH